MTWVAPWMFAGAALAATVVVTLHLIAWDRPQPAPLPTVRFVPDPRDVPAARRRRLVDLPLLALRLLTITLIGAAFAQPIMTPRRMGAARIVLVDRSRSVGNPREVSDSARASVRGGDLVLAFDHEVLPDTSTRATGGPGSLSAALVGAIRSARSQRARLDSSEIVIVSPALAEEFDAATLRIRHEWPGAVRVVRVGGVMRPESSHFPKSRGPADDPVVSATALVTTNAESRLIRGPLTRDDSAFAAAGGTVVHWPLEPRDETRVDAALVSRTSALVAPFMRPANAIYDDAAVLRWSDGAAAATEATVAAGCIRTVNVGVPEGDIVLRPRFLTILRDLAGRCSAHPDPTPAPDSLVAALTAPPQSGIEVTSAAAGLALSPFLFLAALIAALGELFLRSRR